MVFSQSRYPRTSDQTIRGAKHCGGSRLNSPSVPVCLAPCQFPRVARAPIKPRGLHIDGLARVVGHSGPSTHAAPMCRPAPSSRQVRNTSRARVQGFPSAAFVYALLPKNTVEDDGVQRNVDVPERPATSNEGSSWSRHPPPFSSCSNKKTRRGPARNSERGSNK